MTASWITENKLEVCPKHKQLLYGRENKIAPYTSKRTLNIDIKLDILVEKNYSPT